MMLHCPPAADPTPPVPPAAPPATPLESVDAPAADVAASAAQPPVEEEPVPGCSHWSTPGKKIQKKKIAVPPTQMTTRSKRGKLFHFSYFLHFLLNFLF